MKLVCLVLVLCMGSVSAWGKDGHCIIADIAQSLLQDDTRRGVMKLLGSEGNMSAVANWADSIVHQPEFKWTAPLHFANILDPSSKCKDYKEKCTFVYNRDCVGKDGTPNFCNAGAIFNYTQQLLKGVQSGRTDEPIVQALKFLIHFIGDTHQPLHCGLMEDRGGVLINVEFPVKGQGSNWNLHNVWDFGLIVNAEKSEGNRLPLIKQIVHQLETTWAKNVTTWREDTFPPSWVQESLDQALKYSYRFANGTLVPLTPSRDDVIVMGDSVNAYMRTGGVIEQQLAKGAVRLAETLDYIWSYSRDRSPAAQKS